MLLLALPVLAVVCRVPAYLAARLPHLPSSSTPRITCTPARAFVRDAVAPASVFLSPFARRLCLSLPVSQRSHSAPVSPTAMPLSNLFRGVLNRAPRQRGGGAPGEAYCPVVTCETLKQLQKPKKRQLTAQWLRDEMLVFAGPGRMFDLAAMRPPAPSPAVLVRANDFFVSRLEKIERDADLGFMWLCEDEVGPPDDAINADAKDTNKADGTPYLPSSTGDTPLGIACWCWARTAMGQPETRKPECAICGGLTEACQKAMTGAYKRIWGGCGFPLVGQSIAMPRIDCFSTRQRAAYSIAVSLATLCVVADTAGAGDAATELGSLLESWLPVLGREWPERACVRRSVR